MPRTRSSRGEHYPGLVVQDDRVTGLITTGQSRLPLWCFVGTAILEGWESVEHNWQPSRYGWTAERMGTFLANLFESRGPWGRLLLVLADVHRLEIHSMNVPGPIAWWDEHPRSIKRVRKALQECLDSLPPEEEQ